MSSAGPRLLIVTTGSSDVQLVCDGKRWEFDKDYLREIHSELLKRHSEIRFVDTPVSKVVERKDLPAGALDICTPKLDVALRSENYDATDHVLLLGTARQDRSDPHAAVQLLAERLHRIGTPKARIHTCNYLRDTERLEAENSREVAELQDRVVNRFVVKRIEDSVREVFRVVKPESVILALSGGFPKVKSLVEEIVKLHAVAVRIDETHVKIIDSVDRSKSDPPRPSYIDDKSEWDPTDSFRTRRRVLSLIRDGHLIGARAVAKPYYKFRHEEYWTSITEWLYQYAASLPLDPRCDIAILKHRRMAVRAALKTECALRADDIPGAVLGTVAFVEAALWDGLHEKLEKHPAGVGDRSMRNTYRLRKPYDAERPLGEKTNRLVRRPGDRDERKQPFEEIDNSGWYRVYDGGGGCAYRLACDFLGREHLTKVCQLLDKKDGVRELRNDVAHNVPTDDLMALAESRMQAEGFWPVRTTSVGRSLMTFIGQPIIQSVLEELDVENPKSLYEDLIREVTARLLATPYT